MPRIGIDARKLDDGGIGRYVRELLRRLPALAPGIELVAAVPPEAAARAAALAPGVRFVEARAPGYSLAEHRELARLFAAAGCDLVHLPHYVMPAFLRGTRIVVTIHDLVHRRLPRSPLHGLYARAMLALVRRRATAVIAPTEAVARDLAELARVAPERIHRIPHGVADEFLVAGPPPAAEVEGWLGGRGVPRPYVLNVTNGLPHKGLEPLVGALAELPDLRLVVAGIGSGGEPVRAALAALPGQRATVLGEVSDAELRLLYAGAAVVAIPSLYEGFGLPALEAMAAGGVVVASRVGGLPEVCDDAAFLVPPGSVACLRDALYRVAFELHRTEREGLILRGLSRARQFSWDRSARATCALFERLLAGPL